jgi:transcriptional regulator with XRE-family HTH domain
MGQIRDTQLLQTIAIVLKELREDKGLTQEDVFYETKIHIGRIESAKANLTVSTISKLCDFYNIKLSDFFLKVENH